jgi:two-component system sensor histidine kinase VanS
MRVAYTATLAVAFVSVLFANTLGHSHDPVDAFHSLLRDSIPLLLVGLLVCGAIGWWGADRTLRRLDAVTAVARSISGERLDERITQPHSHDEIGALAAALNDMLDRLQLAMELERRFAKHASHELRTPLAIVRGELELALDGADLEPKEWRTTALLIQQHVDSLIDVVDHLLTLPVTLEATLRATVRLAPLVQRQLDLQSRAIGRRSLAVTTSLTDVCVAGDAVLIEQLVRNLIDNAVTHNVDGGFIDIRVTEESSQPNLRVSNQTGGPSIAPSNGQISGPSSVHDHGVGLPLTEAIARAHGGTVTAASPRPGVIDTTVTFPNPNPGLTPPASRSVATRAAHRRSLLRQPSA